MAPPVIAGRAPPHDLDAEAAVLSAVLLSREALDEVVQLRPEHFYSAANGRIFEAMLDLAEAGTPIDVVTVSVWLRDRERLQAAGGTTYIADLLDAVPAVANVATYAELVREKWRLRSAILEFQMSAATAYGDVSDIQEFLDGVEGRIFALTHEPETSGLVPVRTPLQQVFTKVSELAQRGERVSGVPTGYDRLDALTAGLHEGDLVIVAGRPGMGKTSFVMNLATNVAAPRRVTIHGQTMERHGCGVAVFSLEMPSEQLVSRMVCSEGRIDLTRMRRGALQRDDWSNMTVASSFISSLPIWIDDTPSLGVLDIRAKVRRLQAEHNRNLGTPDERRVGLVVIDYLQLMKGRADAPSREQEISEISRGLKALAKELKVPVIALSQLNRAVETRATKNKYPQLSDLRESGAIEQDADTIIFVYRDDYYNEDSTKKGIAELIIAKQRNGPTGKAYVRFTSHCTRFDNLELNEYPVDEE